MTHEPAFAGFWTLKRPFGGIEKLFARRHYRWLKERSSRNHPKQTRPGQTSHVECLIPFLFGNGSLGSKDSKLGEGSAKGCPLNDLSGYFARYRDEDVVNSIEYAALIAFHVIEWFDCDAFPLDLAMFYKI